jgi:hypothetical protein
MKTAVIVSGWLMTFYRKRKHPKQNRHRLHYQHIYQLQNQFWKMMKWKWLHSRRYSKKQTALSDNRIRDFLTWAAAKGNPHLFFTR